MNNDSIGNQSGKPLGDPWAMHGQCSGDFRHCLGNAQVMLRQCSGDTQVMFRWCMGNALAMLRRCLGDTWAMLGRCLGNALEMLWQCLGNALIGTHQEQLGAYYELRVFKLNFGCTLGYSLSSALLVTLIKFISLCNIKLLFEQLCTPSRRFQNW